MSDRAGHSPSSSPLGTCPRCNVDIAPLNLLIQYETNDGWERQFAACPECDDVVHPADPDESVPADDELNSPSV